MIKYDENFDAYQHVNDFTKSFESTPKNLLVKVIAEIPLQKIIDVNEIIHDPIKHNHWIFNEEGFSIKVGNYIIDAHRSQKLVFVNALCPTVLDYILLFQINDGDWMTCISIAPEDVELKCIEKMIEAAQSLLNFE